MFFLFQYIECANVCQRDKANCDGFTVSGSDCHLGSPSRSETVVSSPQSSDENFYLAKGALHSTFQEKICIFPYHLRLFGYPHTPSGTC